MNINTALRKRKLGLTTRVDIDFAVDRIRLKDAIKLDPDQSYDDPNLIPSLKSSGPMACDRVNSDIVAVANEDGYINLLQTNKLKDAAHWIGHENAIFDLKANPDRKTILTASGDGSIKHWDVESKKEIAMIKPHLSSVKSVSIYDTNTFASGSRDGTIQVHDLRQKKPTLVVIREAHRNLILAKPRRSASRTDPISCVTNVAFDPLFPRIYSTGANDATIKLWDLRNTHINKKRTQDGQFVVNNPLVEVPHPTKGHHCGYSHLLISSNKVYAACSDNKIYCYDNFMPTAMPTKFTGFQYDTYLKLAVVDDRFLISGAKRGGAIVWSLGNKCSSMYYPETTKQPMGQLKPDDNYKNDTNVIETDWDSLSIFTFRDDRLVCKWSLQHVDESERERLNNNPSLSINRNDVSIQMSDIMDVSVLRPYNQINNSQVVL